VIGTVFKVGFLNHRRDRAAQAMTFLLPIVFFSIFAWVFGGSTGRPMPKVRVALVDEDHSETSERLAAALAREDGLEVRTASRQGEVEVPLDREEARKLVKSGELPVAVILPKGLGASPMWGGEERPEVQILADPADPVAPHIVHGLLQKVAMTSLDDVMMRDGIDAFARFAGPLTDEQRANVDRWLPTLREGASGGGTGQGGPGQALLATRTVDVIRDQDRNKPIIAFYAAGIGVMWLLFTCAAAGGALLEEEESGTLERLLASRLGMNRLLLGKWLWVAVLGFVQLTVMFAWGAAVFGLDLLGHLGGFALVTAFTTVAGSALGLVLAASCRSRAQLSGLSTIVILVMSAVGGSMFPRYLMPEAMKKAGLLTFNGWALDAYQKVFWRDATLLALWPQLAVLAALTVVFLAITRLLARRWETV
jgi:ABC-2 type transport system permease protein